MENWCVCSWDISSQISYLWPENVSFLWSLGLLNAEQGKYFFSIICNAIPFPRSLDGTATHTGSEHRGQTQEKAQESGRLICLNRQTYVHIWGYTQSRYFLKSRSCHRFSETSPDSLRWKIRKREKSLKETWQKTKKQKQPHQDDGTYNIKQGTASMSKEWVKVECI